MRKHLEKRNKGDTTKILPFLWKKRKNANIGAPGGNIVGQQKTNRWMFDTSNCWVRTPKKGGKWSTGRQPLLIQRRPSAVSRKNP